MPFSPASADANTLTPFGACFASQPCLSWSRVGTADGSMAQSRRSVPIALASPSAPSKECAT